MSQQPHDSSRTSSRTPIEPRALPGSGSKRLWRSQKLGVLIGALATAAFSFGNTAEAAPRRSDWCNSLWSTDNANSTSNGVSWIDALSIPPGATSATASGVTANLTVPPAFPGTGTVAALGIHTESGTLYAFDRSGTTGTLYRYKFGTDTTWQTVTVSGLLGLTGSQTTAGASNNLNKMTVAGNTLYIAESVGLAVYSIPLNANGTVPAGTTAAKTVYAYSGDPSGTPVHLLVRPSGLLRIDQTELWLRAGRVVHVKHPRLQGRSAVLEAFSVQRGAFQFDANATEVKATISLDPAKLVIEAAIREAELLGRATLF